MGIPLAGCSRWRVERIDECKKNRSCMVFVKLVVAVLGLMRRNAAGSAVSSGSISLRKNNQEGTRHDSDKSNGQGDNGACRVAVCLSGAIRSFVHHAVHGSIKGNLIEAIQGDDCEVDVFAYATGKDVVGSGKEETNPEFTPNASAIETALAVLAPTRLIWHQEQAGIIPNSCPTAAGAFDKRVSAMSGDGDHSGAASWKRKMRRPDASNNFYWQLYKSLSAYGMALREEKRRGHGFAYDWIIRGRFDVAWVRPLPPLRSFSREAVWVGRHYWPVSDQFAMVPRAFSDRFFKAITAFYACDDQSWPPPVPWWQPVCGGGFEESVLFRHLHAFNVPYRYYFMFEYEIARGVLGGMCQLGQTIFGEVCTLLERVGAFRSPFNSKECNETLAEWASLRCRTLLPAKGMSDARRTDAILSSDPRAWEKLVESSSPEPISGRVASDVVGDTFTIGENLQYTTVPTTKDVDRVHSKLVVLRDAVLVPVNSATDDKPSIFDNFEAKNSSHSGRWGGWQMLPPWSVSSLTGCSLAEPRFSDLSPHVVSYYTMGAPLVRELAQALGCFVHGLVEKVDENERDFGGSSCEGTRSPEIVMIDVALHMEELGVCTADHSLGLSALDYISDFFREPAVNCRGYDNMENEQTVR